MAYFLVRGYNIPPKREVHRSLQVNCLWPEADVALADRLEASRKRSAPPGSALPEEVEVAEASQL